MGYDEGQETIVPSSPENGGESECCTPIDDHRFHCEGVLIEFQLADDGTVPALAYANSFTFRPLPAYDC